MNYAECIAAGIDARKVAKYEKRLEKLLSEMKADNIMLFGGGDGSSLRPYKGEPSTMLLILSSIGAINLDGGAGAYGTQHSDDGLNRGET